MTFPNNIKDRVNALSLSSSLVLAAEQTKINMGRVDPFLEPLFSLEDHSFIIYSFLIDKLVLEVSSWMLYSCSNICNCSLPFCTTHSTGFLFQANIKSFGNSSILSSSHLFYSFLNATRQDNQFALLLIYIYIYILLRNSVLVSAHDNRFLV